MDGHVDDVVIETAVPDHTPHADQAIIVANANCIERSRQALAGGGIQGGRVVGATDKDGVEVLENPVNVPDLMATIYTCLGIDPRKQNMSPLGRPIRLSDGGTPVKDLLG